MRARIADVGFQAQVGPDAAPGDVGEADRARKMADPRSTHCAWRVATADQDGRDEAHQPIHQPLGQRTGQHLPASLDQHRLDAALRKLPEQPLKRYAPLAGRQLKDFNAPLGQDAACGIEL
jgi:hypothetical protein